MKILSKSNRFAALSVSAIVLMCCSIGRADITGVTDWNYSTGLYCYSPILDSSPQLTLNADLSTLGWEHMGGTLIANTPVDPTLTINDQINNDSGFAWSGFILNVSMSTNFSLNLPVSLVPPTLPVGNPGGWTGSITVAPHFDVGSGLYVGQITFSGGTPVSPVSLDPNNILSLTYQITFSGSTSYSFAEQVSAVPVPEPATFSLLGFGMLMAVLKFRRRI